MTTTLVIIHLSSLDSYCDLEYEATNSRDNSYDLAFRMVGRVQDHKGPVVIVDQGWLFTGRESRPRGQFLTGIETSNEDYRKFQSDVEELGVQKQHGPDRDILWMKFDEQYTSWGEFLPEFDRLLKKLGTEKVLLRGLFFEEKGGCVTETYNHLKSVGMPVEIMLDAVGCTEEYYGPEEDLPGGYTR